MATAVRTDPVSAADEGNISEISWAAIIAGAIAIAALMLVLMAFGSAVGFSSVSPWAGSGVSEHTFNIATGIYLIVAAMLSSTVGGYLCGRLRHSWKGAYSYEVLFRDTAHGFVAWGLATLVGAAALGNAAIYLVDGTPARGAAEASTSAGQTAGPNDYFAAMLLRPAADHPTAASTQGSAAPLAAREARAIFAHRRGARDNLSGADRTYLAQLVAERTGLDPAQATQRVTAVVNQAKSEADETRKAAASLSIWIAISMLVGAFSASLAAIEGGQVRDRRWKGVFGTRAYLDARIDN
jgi:hypothetical protein